MSGTARARRPMKQGYFTVPENPAEPPKLMGTVCKDCGEYFFPKRVVCAKCLSENTGDAMLGPQGTLYSYTFVHFPLFGSTKVEHAPTSLSPAPTLWCAAFHSRIPGAAGSAAIRPGRS